jgi:hypothetical protein
VCPNETSSPAIFVSIVLWRIDPLPSCDSVNSGRYLVTAGKHVNNIRTIVTQPPITLELLLGRCFLLGPPLGYI